MCDILEAVSGEQTTTPGRTPGAGRLVVGVGLPVVCAATTVMVPLLTWSHLPDPLAIHFGGSGAADGTLPRLGALLLGAGLSVLGGAGIVWATFFRARSPWANPTGIRAGLAVAAFIAGLGAALEVSLVIANYGAQNWSLAQLPGYALVLTLALPIILASATYALAGQIAADD